MSPIVESLASPVQAALYKKLQPIINWELNEGGLRAEDVAVALSMLIASAVWFERQKKAH